MSDTNKFDTGAYVRKLRGGMSQEDFADLLGVSRKTVIRIEANEAVPSSELLLKFNVLYGADPLYVLTGSAGSGQTAGFVDQEESKLLEAYRRCPVSVKAHLIKTAELLAAGGTAPAQTPAGQINIGDGAVQVGHVGGNVTVEKGR